MRRSPKNRVATIKHGSKIIELSELRGGDDFPAYAAVYTLRSKPAFLLSPDIMRWNDTVTVSRLDDCKDFWLRQQKNRGVKLTDLFDSLLRHHCGEPYIAVFGNHPWQCLLYLDYQRRHQATGIFWLQSRLGRNIFKTLDWNGWFAVQQDLVSHWLALNAKGFCQQSFHSRQAQMQRFIQRIGVATPFEMNTADANSISRRFGKWLGLIWQWSYAESPGLSSFPWLRLQPETPPAVNRDLEYPLNQWSYIEVLLRQDLSRLSEQLQQDDCEHINRMQWEIVLFNCRKISVELSFRHPYSLHRDQPGFDTALYQARYLYDALMRDLQARDKDLDLPPSMPFLSWGIEVKERVMLAPVLWDLFACEFEQIDYQRMMTLQNKLPRAFECYRSGASFLPEYSFTRAAPGALESSAADHYVWSCSASNKPLFYYPSAQPIEPPPPRQRIFLERAADQWWLSQDSLHSVRDYFMVKDDKGCASWAFRDQDGVWFKQGEFY